MLQKIRDKSQGWIAWTIVIAICLVFALWGIHSYMYSNQLADVVAKVDGQKITQQELNNTIEQIRMQQRLQSNNQTPPPMDVLKQYALQSMISSALLNHVAVKNGFYVDPLLVASAIATMPAFQENGQFSTARFNNLLNALGYSQQQLLDQIGQQILSNHIQQGIVQTEFSLPNEVTRAIQLIQQKRNFDYTVIPAKHFLSSIQPSDKELSDYYQQHLDQFKIPEKVSIDYLELSVNDLMKKVQPTEAELQKYYQDNLANYTQSKQSQKVLPLSSVKNNVMAAFKQQKAEEQFSDLSDQLSNITYENPNSLAEAAKQLNLKVQTTKLFTAEGGSTGIISNPKVIQAAFSDTVLAQNNNSDLVNLSDSDVIVLRIHDHQASGEKSLESVKPQILDVLRQQGAEAKAESMGQQMITLINQGQPFCQAAKQFNGSCSQSGLVALNAKTISPAILAMAFKMPRPSSQGARTNEGTALPNGDYVVISLKDIQLGDASKASITPQISSVSADSLGAINYQLFIKSLRDKAKIVEY